LVIVGEGKFLLLVVGLGALSVWGHQGYVMILWFQRKWSVL
jgi:hypothetical protein